MISKSGSKVGLIDAWMCKLVTCSLDTFSALLSPGVVRLGAWRIANFQEDLIPWLWSAPVGSLV